MKLTDEILNKYIDGELDRNEINELQQLIKIDNEALAILKAHKYVDQILKKLETESAPVRFTENVMNKIFETFTVKNKKFPFFRVILSLFGFMLAGILVYVTSVSMSISSDDKLDSILYQTSDFILTGISFLSNAFSNSIFLMVVSSFSLILLLSAYFVFESHKTFKDKIKGM